MYTFFCGSVSKCKCICCLAVCMCVIFIVFNLMTHVLVGEVPVDGLLNKYKSIILKINPGP